MMCHRVVRVCLIIQSNNMLMSIRPKRNEIDTRVSFVNSTIVKKKLNDQQSR